MTDALPSRTRLGCKRCDAVRELVASEAESVRLHGAVGAAVAALERHGLAGVADQVRALAAGLPVEPEVPCG